MTFIGHLNSHTFNHRLGTLEQASTNDADARVNQFGVHDHGAGFRRNLVETAIDATTFLGPIGTIAHGGNAIRHLFNGDFGSALTSAGKGVASLIPGVNLLVGGASMLKNASDTAVHAGGWMEQQARFGGYENATRVAQSMVYGNAFGGAALGYGMNPNGMNRWY
jgi:hypothetical protein